MAESLLSGINHVALAAADVDATVRFYRDAFGLESTDFSDPAALEVIRDRLVALDATDGVILDTAGVALTVRFTDPDGRRLEVTAYP